MDPLKSSLLYICGQTWVDFQGDCSDIDVQAEVDSMIARNKVIQGLCDGDLPEDYALDYLAEDGFDPYKWLETIEQQLIELPDEYLIEACLNN